jgi:ATP-binding cassette, subfamily C (CFTR/MRP), member 4
MGMRIRLQCSGLIYRKAFSLKLSTLDEQAGGKLLNLISNDTTKLEYSPYFAAMMILGPLQLIIIIVLLIKLINVNILSGFLVILLAIPIQALLGKLMDHTRRIILKKCDRRIDLLNEVFNGIKIIKMYCWETPYKGAIEALRKKEIKFQSYLHVIRTVASVIFSVLPGLITYTSISFLYLFTDLPLLPSYIVLAMSFYMTLSINMGVLFVRGLQTLICANVSAKRVKDFLLEQEMIKVKFEPADVPEIIANKLCTNWSPEHEETGFSLDNLTFEVKPNQLVAIIGPTGSGKSSLLLSIIGEMEKMSGNVEIKGSVFYVAQEPWIFTSSLKQNILFGKPFDRTKFDKITKACCLDVDLNSFPDGENTIIGEKGVNLSGGQRARVSVARALYSDAQIYLFDDPLSAVDSNVQKFLFDQCINGFLKSKIRILVTHQVHHVTNADQIWIINNGRIESNGTYDSLVKQGINMEAFIDTIEKEKQLKKENEKKLRIKKEAERLSKLTDRLSRTDSNELKKQTDSTESLVKNSQSYELRTMLKSDDESIRLVEYEEVQSAGILSWKTYFYYFNIGGGIIGTILCFIMFFGGHAVLVAANYWVFKWFVNEFLYLN